MSRDRAGQPRRRRIFAPKVGRWRSEDARARYLKAYDEVLSQVAAPDETRDIQTQFGTVHAIVWQGPADSGAPVLLLPGRSSGAPMWVENLPSWIGKRTLIALDPIGDAGLSNQTKPLTSPAEQGEWLSQAVSGLNLGPVHAVGHSFGGATAAEFVLAHPDQMASLTLLEPVMVLSNMPLSIYFWATIAILPTPQSWRDRALAEIGGTTVEEVQELTPMSEMIDVASQGYSAELPQPRKLSDEQWKSLTMPVRLDIGGDSTLAGGAKSADRIRTLLPHATVTVWPGGTHSLPMEEHEHIGEELLDFWNKAENF
ncbi:alpha/beta fold hydrolase [Corynebacterium sp. S7]